MILPFLLLFLSCSKQESGRLSEPFTPHPVWTDSTPDAFWDKQPAQEPDTVLNVDITIYF